MRKLEKNFFCWSCILIWYNNTFSVLGGVLCIFLAKKCKKYAFLFKNGFTSCSLWRHIITIATDCLQNLPNCVSGINEQLLKTARANNKCSCKNWRKIWSGWHLPPPPPPCTSKGYTSLLLYRIYSGLTIKFKPICSLSTTFFYAVFYCHYRHSFAFI